jgi:hypothetical protein
MHELKKNGKLFTSKFVGTGPSSYKEKNLPGSGLTNVEKHWSNLLRFLISMLLLWIQRTPIAVSIPFWPGIT